MFNKTLNRKSIDGNDKSNVDSSSNNNQIINLKTRNGEFEKPAMQSANNAKIVNKKLSASIELGK